MTENSFYLNHSQSLENNPTHPNKHVHIWNQNIYNLDRAEMNSRASRIVRSIKDRISGLSLPRSTPGGLIQLMPETRTTTSISKKTLCTQSKLSKFSRSSKRISLVHKLEEFEQKMKESQNFEFSESFNKSLCESQTLKNLFHGNDVLSESTLAKIQDFDRKVMNMRESLNNFGNKETDGFKKSRAIKKFRVTQYFGKRLKANRKAKAQFTII
jgi:hypothetical protein